MKTRYITIRNHHPLQLWRRLAVLLIAVALVGIEGGPNRVAARSAAAQSNVVLQTAAVPMLAGTFSVVDNSDNDQYDAHVNCGLASYTSDDRSGVAEIRYYDFATKTARDPWQRGGLSL